MHRGGAECERLDQRPVLLRDEVALALLRRYGYSVNYVLKNHIFGQDYCIVERAYTKVTEGYDHGVGPGRLGRILRGVKSAVGLR